MQPDTPNFEFLAVLYGTSTTPAGQTQSASSTAAQASGANDGTNDGTRRLRQGMRPAGTRPVPDSVVEAFDNVDLLLDSGTGWTGVPGWRKLHESKYGEAREMYAGDGFTIQIHMLKYLPES